MSDAKLMMPLFCNGMFNCGGRRIRAVHLYDVSDGEHRYRLWTKAGTPDIDYPRVESDRYLLYVEIHGYLAPLGMTEYFLTEHCGYLPAMRELYGGAEHRRTYFDTLQKSAIEEAVAIERTVIYHLGKESPRQADYIHGICICLSHAAPVILNVRFSACSRPGLPIPLTALSWNMTTLHMAGALALPGTMKIA